MSNIVKDSKSNKRSEWNMVYEDISHIIPNPMETIMEKDPWLFTKILTMVYLKNKSLGQELSKDTKVDPSSLKISITINLDEDFVNKTMEGNKDLQSLLGEFNNIMARVESQDDYTKKLFYDVIKQTYKL